MFALVYETDRTLYRENEQVIVFDLKREAEAYIEIAYRKTHSEFEVVDITQADLYLDSLYVKYQDDEPLLDQLDQVLDSLDILTDIGWKSGNKYLVLTKIEDLSGRFQHRKIDMALAIDKDDPEEITFWIDVHTKRNKHVMSLVGRESIEQIVKTDVRVKSPEEYLFKAILNQDYIKDNESLLISLYSMEADEETYYLPSETVYKKEVYRKLTIPFILEMEGV